MKRIFTLILFLLAATAYLHAQTQVLKGTVSDEVGPLPGASVTIKETQKGTTTDLKGNFQITIKNGESIVFSALGFESQTVKFIGQENLKITLKPVSISLNETVVVGYATQKKVTLTGSVGAVSGTELNTRSVASLSTALQGKIAGVTVQQTSGQPGADGSNIRIRGIGSINSTTFPLVLMDGIETNINQIDMNTVESVSVLKDAASASIYGSRAANGVILITTKRGKLGKPIITVNSNYTMNRISSWPGLLSPDEFLSWRQDVRYSMRGYDSTSKPGMKYFESDPRKLPNGFTVDQWLGLSGQVGADLQLLGAAWRFPQTPRMSRG